MNIYDNDNIPKEIVSAPNQKLPVNLKKLDGRKLGYFDPKTGEIAIREDLPKVGKHHILLHEMIHLAAAKLKQEGVCKRHPSESFITYLTGALFPMLALSGLWSGVSSEEAEKWLEKFIDEDNP